MSMLLQMGCILSMRPCIYAAMATEWNINRATDGLHSVRAAMLLALEWSLKRALGKAIASHTGMLELSALITVLERPYC